MIKRFFGKFRPSNGVKTPVYLQFSETECGIAALAALLAYYKTYVSLESLREKCGSSRDGCKASTLIKVAQGYGYIAEAYSVDIEEIKNLSHPVIAFWNFSHYVVIDGVGEKKVYINDPAYGSLSIGFDEFDKSFTGIIIAILPTKSAIKLKKKSIIGPLIRESISAFYVELMFVLICMVMVVLSPLLNSNLSTLFINYCVIYNNQDWIPYIAVTSFVLMGIISISTVYQKWTQFRLCSKASLLKASEVISHIFQLPLLFYSLRQKGEIIVILARAEMVMNLLFKSATSFMVSVVATLICLIFMLEIDAYLFMASLMISAMTMCLFFIISRINISFDQSYANSLGRWYMRTLSSIKNIETIKSCGLEGATLSNWRSLFCNKLKSQDQVNTLTSFLDEMNKSLGSISMLVMLFMGGYRISDGHISIGQLMGYYALHLFLVNHLTLVVRAFKDGQESYVSHIRINDVFMHDKDQRFQIKKNNLIINQQNLVLSCANVNFHYNKMEPFTVADINIIVESGNHIALVGRSGSGKSTLAKLLCALYRPSGGNITLNEKSIFDLTSSELAHYFSYVSQDVSLFSGTIYENLTLWREDIPIESIKNAIRDSCLEDVISLRGLYGKVAENGDNFSGGEKQRIEIARALIQNTPILILDEATSALDMHTEANLIKNLRHHTKTIIYVAHRLSTISHCDQIYVMHNGVVIECGNHVQLIKNKGAYYGLIQSEQQA